MPLEALSILVYSVLIFIALAVQGGYASMTAGTAYGFSNRVDAQPGKGPAGHRIDKTLGNLKEGGILYLPLALLAVSLDISNGWTWWAALVTIVSRLVYVPVFYFGIPVVRTFVWVPSFFAVPVMAVGILVGAP